MAAAAAKWSLIVLLMSGRLDLTSCQVSSIFPKSSDMVLVPMDTEGLCFTQTPDQLTDPIVKCRNEGKLYVQMLGKCNEFCCFSDSDVDDGMSYVVRWDAFDFSACAEHDLLVDVSVTSMGGEISTYYVTEGGDQDWAGDGDEDGRTMFRACVPESVGLSLMSDDGSGDTGVFGATVDSSMATEVLTSPLQSELAIRVWDLVSDCHRNWFFRSGQNGPVGYFASDYRSYAIYCTSSKSCADVSIAHTEEEGPNRQLVDFFFDQSVCVNKGYISGLGEHFYDISTINGGEYELCTSACGRFDNIEIAFIGESLCICASTEYARSVPVQHVGNSGSLCDHECPDKAEADEDPFLCGSEENLDSVGQPYLSAYVITQEPVDNRGYKYWQCAREHLFNKPQQVLHGDLLLKADEPLRDASDCLRLCDEGNFSVAMIHSSEMDGFGCTCLNLYKFRLQDLSDECVYSWCPSVRGPCVEINMSKSGQGMPHSAVYCRGADQCGANLLLEHDFYGVCQSSPDAEEPKRKPDPQGVRSVYYECDYVDGMYRWEKRFCDASKGMSFDEHTNKCVDKWCEQKDARGQDWTAPIGQNAEKKCFYDATSEDERLATWFCDAKTAPLFSTLQPDRTECKEEWVTDVETLISDGNNSVDIAETILLNVKPAEDETSFVTGGSLLALPSDMTSLIQLHAKQVSQDPDHDFSVTMTFTETLLEAIDALLASQYSWQELLDSGLRFNTSSGLMLNVDQIGRMYNELKGTTSVCQGGQDDPTSEAYRYQVLQVELRQDPANGATASDRIVFGAGNVQIKVPTDFFSPEATCFEYLGASFNIDHAGTQMLPESPSPTHGAKEGTVPAGLYSSILDFSVLENFRLNPPNELSQKVEITFQHENRLRLQPQCVFWNFRRLTWDTQGCQLNEQRSNRLQTTCDCDHLTNFAIIFGDGQADDDTLSMLSIALGVVSCSCILVTIAFLHWLKQTSSSRQIVELNRNYCLLGGQLLFLSAIGLEEFVDGTVCTIITFAAHYVWLAVFFWTALEGYLLYYALVVVFDSVHHRPWTLYALGYGVAICCASATFLAALFSDLGPYYRPDACWLSDVYIWTFKGPVAAVLLGNTFVLVIGLRAAYKVAKRRKISTLKKLRGRARNFLLLSYLLGTTWLVGFLNPLHESLHYVFVVLNASTGVFILLYGVVFNTRMREASKKTLRKKTLTTTKSTKMSNNNNNNKNKNNSTPPTPRLAYERGEAAQRVDTLSNGTGPAAYTVFQ